MKIGKFEFPPKLDRLEVYLLAADNPVGKKQFRPIFRRKRNKIVLTREQVYAIKRGRRVLRAEMKARGLKRRIDFEETATNLGLYFDHKGLFWPFFLWLIKDNTVAKILATTAVLTTIVTVTEPVIEYVTQIVTQTITQIITETITETIDKDRFTISMSDEMFDEGFQLAKSKDFAQPSQRLVFDPVWDASPISIADIPWDIDKDVLTLADAGESLEDEENPEEEPPEGEEGSDSPENALLQRGQDTDYFACTFYYRYINNNATAEAETDPHMSLIPYQTTYNWELQITSDILGTLIDDEGNLIDSPEAEDPEEEAPEEAPGEETPETRTKKPSDAIWVMVFRDGELALYAKKGADGNVEKLPSDAILADPKTARAYMERDARQINAGLGNIAPGMTMDNVGKYRQEGQEEAEMVDAFFNRNQVKDLTQLMLRTTKWTDRYRYLLSHSGQDFYQVIPENFESDTVIAKGKDIETLPYVDSQPNVHRYTIVFWMEGDDPDCKNDLMGSHIGMAFQISGNDETAEDAEDPDAPENPGEGA